MSQRLPRALLLLGLLGSAAALAMSFAGQGPLPQPDQSMTRVSVAGTGPGEPERQASVTGLHADAGAATAARPLFSQTRRPPQPLPPTPVVRAPEPVVLPPQTGAFLLLGVVTLNGRPLALLDHPSRESTIRATVGDVIDEWRVEEIRPTLVRLAAGDVTDVVRLHEPSRDRPPLPPRAVPQPVNAQPAAPVAAVPAPAADPAGALQGQPAAAPAQVGGAAPPPQRPAIRALPGGRAPIPEGGR